MSATPVVKPSIIYVQDFVLDPAVIQAHEGLLADLPGPGEAVDKAVYGQEPPPKRAHELIELMSTSLVKDIQEAGYRAMRLRAGDPMPKDGWLVRGTYRRVEEGNRLRRSMIGFGVGKTDVVVAAYFDDLTQCGPQSFVELETDAHTRPLPGSAPSVALSPYPAMARLLLSGKDLTRNVTHSAIRISKELVEQLNAVP
jgi:hypothetical protein